MLFKKQFCLFATTAMTACWTFIVSLINKKIINHVTWDMPLVISAWDQHALYKTSPESWMYWKCPVRRSSELCSVRGEGEPGEGGGWVWRALPLEQLSAESFWRFRYTCRCSSTSFRQLRCSWPQKTCWDGSKDGKMVVREQQVKNVGWGTKEDRGNTVKSRRSVQRLNKNEWYRWRKETKLKKKKCCDKKKARQWHRLTADA